MPNFEEWKRIPNLDYEISSSGRVRSLKSKFLGRILKPRKNKKGYLYVNLCHDGSYKSKSVHVLVASSFLCKPNGNVQVNHKDGNKGNNTVSNLEWTTPRENTLHASKMGLLKGRRGRVATYLNLPNRMLWLFEISMKELIYLTPR